MRKKSVALVLSGGGSKGLAHIGVINELERQGFEITSISGSSIGAVIGGVYAMGKLPEYTEWVKTLKPHSVWSLMDFTFSSRGLLKGEKVFEKMKTFIPDIDIESMNIPFAAVATDILNEQEVVFTSGSYYEAIRASVAIPAIFTPVKYRDTFLVDGAIINPIPIEHVQCGANDLLVVVSLYGERNGEAVEGEKIVQEESVSAKITEFVNMTSSLMSSGKKTSLGYYSLINRTTSVMIHQLARHIIERRSPDMLISMPADSSNIFDFYKSEELIELGHRYASTEISKYCSPLTLKTSAVICAYNEESTIQSVLIAISNYSFDEVIIVNDGSTDNTDALILELVDSHRLKYIKLPENKGKGFAMATGIESASNDIILFLDADMLNFKNEHFARMLQPLQSEEMDMVLGQPSETLINSNFNPFKSFTGQRALLKKDVLPILDKMKVSRFGVETLINLYFQSKGKRIKHIMLDGLEHPTKFEKTTSAQAVKEFAMEGQEIALTTAKNLGLIVDIVNNYISKHTQ